MEILVGIAIVVFSLYFLLKGLTDCIKQLHTSRPKGLLTDGKKLNVNLTISTSDEKKEVCERATNSKRDDLD